MTSPCVINASIRRGHNLFSNYIQISRGITLNLPTHLWIKIHLRLDLDIDSRFQFIGRRNPLESFSKFDRLGVRSLFTIRCVGGCFCLYHNVFGPKFSTSVEKEHTQQTDHEKSKVVTSTKFLPKMIVNPMPSRLRLIQIH